MSSVYDQYRQTAIQTAPPEQLVVMLYDGAIRFLEQAKVGMQDGKDMSEPLSRAQDIIVELASSLNRAAGEVADNLARLYDFWIQWLLQAQIRRDSEKVDEVLGMVRELREAWASIALQQRRAAAVNAAGASAALNARG
ncbi:MAG TPA: flagellar export chaperone FliS [Symbiobacteriaceae bacterium]|nr:flagellar export chaperone FliS [Symbiobacteriaceae bacterium]